MSEQNRCGYCRTVLGPPTGKKGRPASYCSPAHRRAAEHEITRVTNRIGALEFQMSDDRASNMRVFGFDPVLVEAELARQKARLMELFGDEPDVGDAA